MLFLFSLINTFLQIKATQSKGTNTTSVNHPRIILDLFEWSKGGKMLFNIFSIYILFTSITLPLIKYFKSKQEKNKYFHEVSKTIIIIIIIITIIIIIIIE